MKACPVSSKKCETAYRILLGGANIILKYMSKNEEMNQVHLLFID